VTRQVSGLLASLNDPLPASRTLAAASAAAHMLPAACNAEAPQGSPCGASRISAILKGGICMARRNTRRRGGRESQGFVRAVSALSAVAIVAAVLFKVSPF